MKCDETDKLVRDTKDFENKVLLNMCKTGRNA